METKEWKGLVDKSGFPRGEWDNEPDKMQFPNEATGLPCLIVRNRIGALCGYVGVPRSHPAYGKHYDKVNVRVHGGLTFAGRCDGWRICHTPAQGEPDDVWWLGFDCGHSGDVVPEIHRLFLREMIPGTVYRNVAYVKREIASLAKQLSEAT